MLHSCNHRTSLDCRLVQNETQRKYASYVYVLFPATMPTRSNDPSARVTPRTVDQLYGTSVPIIYTAITRNYMRHYRMHRFLIATGGAIRRICTRSYMDRQHLALCQLQNQYAIVSPEQILTPTRVFIEAISYVHLCRSVWMSTGLTRLRTHAMRPSCLQL